MIIVRIQVGWVSLELLMGMIISWCNVLWSNLYTTVNVCVFEYVRVCVCERDRGRERVMINLYLLIFCQNWTSFSQWVLFLYEQTVIRAGNPSGGAGERARAREWVELLLCVLLFVLFTRGGGRLHWRDNSKLIEGCGKAQEHVTVSCWYMVSSRS